MIGPDLAAELEAAAGRVTQAHLDRLAALGIAPATIAGLGRHAISFGVAHIVGIEPGLYAPGDGAPHIVQPVFENWALVDLVAWQTTAPDRWLRRTGAGWALNADNADFIDRFGGPPVLLHATPLDWLRAGATGTVILDWSSPRIERLRWHEEVCCATAALAETLRCRLTEALRLPDITIAPEVSHAA